MFADVAHELRTPLAVVRGNVEGMLDGIYPRDDGHLEVILDETAVMARLLEDLRTLSMAEVGALRLHPESTDLAALVDEALAALTPRATAAGVALLRGVVSLPPVEVDPVRLREVLDNLLANALRHTARGGSVWIEVGLNSRTVTFAVADTGSGIAPKDLPHIFDRFWKSSDSGGSGLGLAIAKGLIEAHGGEIRAESQIGWGTTIRFSLPLDPGNGRVTTPIAAPRHAPLAAPPTAVKQAR
jgi:signal transduction histidine kinase